MSEEQVNILENEICGLQSKIEDLELQVKIYKASLARYDELINAFNLEAVFKDTRPYIYCKGTISAPDALKIADFLLKQEVAYMIKGALNGTNTSE